MLVRKEGKNQGLLIIKNHSKGDLIMSSQVKKTTIVKK